MTQQQQMRDELMNYLLVCGTKGAGKDDIAEHFRAMAEINNWSGHKTTARAIDVLGQLALACNGVNVINGRAYLLR